ncbi:hypothetical protein YC2023_038131 [Brassica napus]
MMFDPHLYKDRFGYTLAMDAVDPNLSKSRMLLGKLSFKLTDYRITTFSFVEILPVNLSRKLKNFVPFPRNNQSLKDAHIQTQLDDTMELMKIKNFVSDISID